MQSDGRYSLVFSVDPSKPAKTQTQAWLGITDGASLGNVCGMNSIDSDSDKGKVYHYHIKWNDAILSSGMFRLQRDCWVYAQQTNSHQNGSGQVYDYEALKWYQKPYMPDVSITVDHDATTGFSTGKWYYNAE